MPNLAAHIDLAYEAAQRLSHPTLDAHMGYFLLGSTSPDIRAMTRGAREEYHFAPLDFGSVGAGVEGLFDAHPDLRSDSDHGGPTRAFIAGYITHLISDEVWIVDMYRPYFGDEGVFEEGIVGKVMDRALQLDLDRQAWPTVMATRQALDDASDGIRIRFIPDETILDWRQWVQSLLDRGFSWDRLRFMAERVAREDGADSAHRAAEDFLDAMPDSLEELYRLVPRQRLADYRERAIESLVRTVGSYLP